MLVRLLEKASWDGTFSSRDPPVDVFLELRHRPGAAVELLPGGHRAGILQVGLWGAAAVFAAVPAAPFDRGAAPRGILAACHRGHDFGDRPYVMGRVFRRDAACAALFV